MIPFLLPESGGASGQTPPRQKTPPEGESTAAFGDLMAEADISIDVETPTGEEAAPASTIMAEDDAHDMEFIRAERQPTQEELASDVPLVPDNAPRARRDADVSLSVPNSKETDLWARAANRPVEPAAPLPVAIRNATPPQVPHSETAEAVLAALKPQRPSVAQAIVEGQLPQSALPEVVTERISDSGLRNMAAADAPPRAGELPIAGHAKGPIFDPGHGPKALPVQLPDAANPPRLQDTPGDILREGRQKTATPAQAAAQPPAVAMAQIPAQSQRQMEEKALNRIDSEVIVTAALTERQAQGPNVQSAAATTAPAETARNAATQIAMAITNTPGKMTEIALNPEELGRVRLSLSASDGVISLNVLAERPETQELLRRHMDLLAQEFRQLGYTSISFTFGEQKGQAHAEEPVPDQAQEVEMEEDVEPSAILTKHPSTGLDLRI